MHKVIARPAMPSDGAVESPEKWLHHNDETGNATGVVTAQSNPNWAGPARKGRDLHPGDVVQQYDWSLHVCEVEIGRAVVAVAVTEFGFELHYAADQMLRVPV